MFNMFGLGILLRVDDQASKGIYGVNQSLQQLSMTAMSLTYMGKNLMDMGQKMLSPIMGLGKSIATVGDDMERTKITLGALYQDAQRGADKLNSIIEYAAKTPFEITGLKESVLQFKTLGVEILGEGSSVTSSSGKTRDFIETISDLGAGLSGVARNGFKDVNYAIREFVTEGNKLSFLRRLGIDIDAVLAKAGMSAANTVEGRLKNMADIAEILHFEGLTQAMFGTWSQLMSNMDDIWTMFIKKVGDAGAFDAMKGTLKKVGDFLSGLVFNSVKFEKFTKSLSSALVSILKPIDWLAQKLVTLTDSFVTFASEHPMVMKVVLLLPALAGGLFMVAGAALVVKGALMVFGYGIGIVASMLPGLLVFVGIFAIVANAWNKDIGHVKTNLNIFMNSIYKSFSEAERISGQAVNLMVSDYNKLKKEYRSGNTQLGLTLRILEVKAIWKSFVDFWGDNKLSDENYNMLKDMGLLPVFSEIAMWTTRFKSLFEGICAGFADVVNTVTWVLSIIKTKLEEVFPLLSEFSNKNGKNIGEDGWRALGKVVGWVITSIVLFKTVMGTVGILGKAIDLIKLPFLFLHSTIRDVAFTAKHSFNVLKTSINTARLNLEVFNFWLKTTKIASGANPLGGLGSTFLTMGRNVWQASTGFIMGLIPAIWGAVVATWSFTAALLANPITWIVIAVIALIAAIVLLVVKWKVVKEALANFGSWCYEKVIKPVCDWFVWLWGKIVSIATSIWGSIKGVFGSVVGWIWETILRPVVKFLTDFMNVVVGIALFIWDGIKLVWGGISSFVNQYIIQPIISFFGMLFRGIVAVVQSIWSTIVAVWGFIASWVNQYIIQPVVSFFAGLFRGIVAVVQSVWSTIVSIWGFISSWVNQYIIQPVISFFSSLWNSIIGVVQSVWSTIVGVWGLISSWIDAYIIQPVISFFDSLMGSIIGVVQSVWSTVKSVWGFISSWVDNNIIQPVANLFSGIYLTLSTTFDSIYTALTGAFQKAWDFVTGLWKGITEFFGNLWGGVTKVVDKFRKRGEEATGIESKNIPHAATGVRNFVGGLIQVNEKGGEIIDLPSGSSVIPHDQSVARALQDGISYGISSMSYAASDLLSGIGVSDKRPASSLGNSLPTMDDFDESRGKNNSPSKVVEVDNSVHFSKGSIVVQVMNASKEEAEKMAELIMQMIEKKQKRQRLASYKY